MTQDFAKPTTTRKPGSGKSKSAKPGTSRQPVKKPGKKAPQSKAKQSKPAPQTASPPKPRRAKFMLSLIALLGAFIYGLYVLQSIPPTPQTEQNSSTTKIKSQASKKPEVTKKTVTEKRFNFYEILPETEVKAPKVDAYKFREKTNQGNFYYMVQTGSFRKEADAERQKATIAFQGLKATIKTISNSNGSKWHRVITGPYHNRSTMNSALDKLVSINIQPLVKKIKKDQ